MNEKLLANAPLNKAKSKIKTEKSWLKCVSYVDTIGRRKLDVKRETECQIVN